MAECNVISHRGANRIAPQNTLEAFKHSILYKADGFETDIHLTKDGVPVICHNYTVDGTSDGKGEISSMTLEELRALDFGSYFHPSYKGVKIPTLEEFLSLVEKANFKILDIEIKPPKNKDYTVVGKTIDAVKNHGLFDKLLISSFDPDALIEVKNYDEKCLTGFLYSPDKKLSLKMMNKPVAFAKSIGADALHPHQVYVSKEYVDIAHTNGIMVNPWTVDKEKDIIKMVEYGVDGVITDVPKEAREIIDSMD